MSRGIWTKHLSVDGKAYFYNSAQNRSVWTPPPDSIIHEAINMRPPTYIELAGASSSYGKSSEFEVMSSSHGLSVPEQIYGEQQHVYDRANESYRSIENHNEYHQYQQDENSFRLSQEHYPPPQDNYYPQTQIAATLQDYSFNDYQGQNGNQESSGNQFQYQDQRDLNNNYHRNDAQQISQSHQQPEQVQLVSADELMSFGVSSKQKQQNSKRFRVQTTDESDQDGRSASSYLQQKSAFEARAGSRDDESGKWLVR